MSGHRCGNLIGTKQTQVPRVISGDKNTAYSVAVNDLKQDKTFKAEPELR